MPAEMFSEASRTTRDRYFRELRRRQNSAQSQLSASERLRRAEALLQLAAAARGAHQASRNNATASWELNRRLLERFR